MSYFVIVITAILLLTLTRMTTTIIHEAGHTIARLLLFNGDLSVYIGSYGDPSQGVHFKLGRIIVHFKYNPLLWSHGVVVGESLEISWLRSFVFILAGPVFSLITAAACLYLLINPYPHGAVKLIALFLLFSSIQDFFSNVIPNKNPIKLYNGTITYNDGQSLKKLIEYRAYYKELVVLSHFESNNEINAGLEYFNKVYKENQDDNLLRMGVALFMKGGDYSSARDLLSNLNLNNGLTTMDYCNLGLTYSHTGQHRKALDSYNKSIEFDSLNVVSLSNRGYTFICLNQFEEAIEDFNQVLSIYPKDAYAISNLGLAKLKLGDEEEGFEQIKKSIQLNKDNSYVIKNMGIYHLHKGELQESLALFNRALDLDPQTHGVKELIQEVRTRSVN